MRLLDFRVRIPESQQVQNAVQPQVGDGVTGTLPDQRLGPECNPQPCRAQHGQIIGTVSHRDHLLQPDVLPGSNVPQQGGLALPVDDLA